MGRSKSPGSTAQRAQAGKQERPAVTRALGMLEAVASLGRPATLHEIAELQNVPIATAFRLCGRLEEAGYLIRHGGSRRYILGARLIRLGLDVVRASGQNLERRRILTEVVEAIGETCNLTTLVGSEVVYIDRVETRWPLRLHLEPGSRVPLHCTASGKLFLAYMPEEPRQRMLAHLPFTAYTPATITSAKAIARELQRIEAAGFSTDNEEFLAGLIAVAVPLRYRDGAVFAALACHAPVARLKLAQAKALVPLLQQAAAKLSRAFEE